MQFQQYEVKRQAVKEKFKSIQRESNKHRDKKYKAQKKAMLEYEKRFFENEEIRWAKLKKQEEKY